MVATRERPTITQEQPIPWWRRPVAIVTGLAVLTALVIGGIVVAGGSDDESTATTGLAQPSTTVDAIAITEQYVAHVRSGDVEAIAAMWGPIAMSEFDRALIEWRFGMGFQPELSDCDVVRTAGSSSTVECATTDPGSGFAALLGGPIAGTLTADVTTDGQFYLQSNPPPTELRPALVGFQAWLKEFRPEATDVILGDDWIGLALSREAGELTLSLLPDYQAFLAGEAGSSPEGIMGRLAAAVRETDPELYADLTYAPFSDDAGGLEFLRWQAALGLDPDFSDCVGNASNVQCTVTAGEDYFFTTLANQEITGTVAASIIDNELYVYSWPPTSEISREERAFRSWIRDHHPDDEIRMFGAVLGLFLFGTESGELHMEYLDEYLAYRGSPAAVSDQMVEAVKLVDPAGYANLTSPPNELGRRFLEWNLAMGMEPVFSDCTPAPPETGATVICNVTMGEDYFFSTVAETNLPTVLLVGVEGNEMSVIAWPPPDGLLRTERALRNWIRDAHPEAADAMFGTDFGEVVSFTRESGRLHAQHLDEFLTYLESIAELTADDVMDRMVAAVIAADPVELAAISYAGADPGGAAFLDWNLELGMEPTFSNCEVQDVTDGITTIACRATMGPAQYFSIVVGEDEPLDLFVEVEDGIMRVLGWPPSEGILDAETEYRSWIRQTHPESEADMFGEILGVFNFSPESAMLHDRYLDEYLMHLAVSA